MRYQILEQVDPLVHANAKESGSTHEHCLVVADKAERFPSISLAFPDVEVRAAVSALSRRLVTKECSFHAGACSKLCRVKGDATLRAPLPPGRSGCLRARLAGMLHWGWCMARLVLMA